MRSMRSSMPRTTSTGERLPDSYSRPNSTMEEKLRESSMLGAEYGAHLFVAVRKRRVEIERAAQMRQALGIAAFPHQ